MRTSLRSMLLAAALVPALASSSPAADAADAKSVDAKWEPCGWGGGGYYYAAVWHPTQAGTIYLGGDVNGVARTDDHGLHWKLINNGLANYGVFSLAVDKTSPDTVYAATESGLCRSDDKGDHWRLLPKTGPKELHITGEKGRSIRCVALDPTNGKTIYAGTPLGKVYKSTDGGQEWTEAYAVQVEGFPAGFKRVQYGKVSGEAWGGLFSPVKFPEGSDAKACTGIGFHFMAGKNATVPNTFFLTIKTADGTYQSKNLKELFSSEQAQDVILGAADFAPDAATKKKNPDVPPAPDWATVNRFDLAASGSLGQEAYVCGITEFFFAFGSAPQVPFKNLATAADKEILRYNNVRVGDAKAGAVYTVAVSPKEPATIAAATADAGVVLSEDGGATWKVLDGPSTKASTVTFDPANPNVLYAAFAGAGIAKSADKGKTWNKLGEGTFDAEMNFKEIAVSPSDPKNVYAVAVIRDWGGSFFSSADGGATWKRVSSIKVDSAPGGNPTLQRASATSTAMSAVTNLTLCPANPKEMYVSCNWESFWSGDGGATWEERERGADISCITDIRFSGKRTYVCAMDEGTLASDDGGATWTQLWPLKFADDLSGHNWRIAVAPGKSGDHLIGTLSPWNQAQVPRTLVSDDGGASYKVVREGLPNYVIRPNTMWGQGHPRALAIDPNDPKIAYLGIDGDAEPGKSGGGIFKSTDGGNTWAQLPNQPASRRMFYGLAVDPTNSKRIFWGACGNSPGVYRSEDGGESWKSVFPYPVWVFNLHVTADGTIYVLEKDVWRSTDHGATWKKLSNFTEGWTGVGFDVDPANPKTMWLSRVTWGGEPLGAVYRSTDDGATWQVITGDIPYVKPLVLRFNPETRELWTGFVGLFKLKQ